MNTYSNFVPASTKDEYIFAHVDVTSRPHWWARQRTETVLVFRTKDVGWWRYAGTGEYTERVVISTLEQGHRAIEAYKAS